MPLPGWFGLPLRVVREDTSNDAPIGVRLAGQGRHNQGNEEMKYRVLVLSDLGWQPMMCGFFTSEDDAWKQVAIFHKAYPGRRFAVQGG